MAGLPPLAGFFGKIALWSAILRKIGSLISGDATLEAIDMFQYDGANVTAETNAIVALGALLILRVIVSIVSAVYYFKLYELSAPAASEAEVKAKPEAQTV